MTARAKLEKSLNLLKEFVKDFEVDIKASADEADEGFAEEALRSIEKTVINLRSRLRSGTKRASIVDRLDQIASELEPVDAVLALAVDKISDRLDPLMGAKYQLTKNLHVEVYETYDGKKGEGFVLQRTPIGIFSLKSKTSGKKVRWEREHGSITQETADPSVEFNSPASKEWWEVNSDGTYVLRKPYTFLIHETVMLPKGSVVKPLKTVNTATPNSKEKRISIVFDTPKGQIMYPEFFVQDDSDTFRKLDSETK